MKPSFLPLADPRRTLPRDAASRRAMAEAAVNTLAAEQLRLADGGEEWMLARTGYQLRYWRFVRALVQLDIAKDARDVAQDPRSAHDVTKDPRSARVNANRRAA
jgi:hypothetical protein